MGTIRWTVGPIIGVISIALVTAHLGLEEEDGPQAFLL